MKALYCAIGVVWMCSLLGGDGERDKRKASGNAATSAETTVRPASPITDGILSLPGSGPTSAPRTDLFGNEVEDALADYRIDRGGEVYERHSPETAVLQLGSPVS